MHNTTTRSTGNTLSATLSQKRKQTRQAALHLIHQITEYNLSVRHPTLTPIERLGRMMLLILHHATRPVTDAHLCTALHVSPIMGQAALARLQYEHYITPTTKDTSRTTRATTVDITLTGRVRAQRDTSWTTVMLQFIPHASPRALREFHRSLARCLRQAQQTAPVRRPLLPVTTAPSRRTPSSPHHRTTALA